MAARVIGTELAATLIVNTPHKQLRKNIYVYVVQHILKIDLQYSTAPTEMVFGALPSNDGQAKIGE